MKTPHFWQHKGIVPCLLKPFGFIYGAATALRLKIKQPYKCGAKVICIGNITAGGVGKTPVAIAFAEAYIAAGKKVFFLTRGYKSELKNILVDLNQHTPKETGDEARLLATYAPTIISPKREDGAKLAVKLGAEVIIMDDGFQNPGLYKDESYLVFDGAFGLGNGMLIPAGPLRETLAAGKKRATAAIIMGKDQTGLSSRLNMPVFYGKLQPKEVSNLKGKRVFAFAGIGRPEKFYQTLHELGLEIAGTADFADHYAYTKADIAALKKQASDTFATLITTEKDYVKLLPQWREDITVLKVKATIDGLNLQG